MATNPKRLVQPTAALTALCLFGSIANAQVAEAPDNEPQPLASGLQLSLKLEPGFATALSDPQSDMTKVGMGSTAKLLFGLNRYLQIGPSIAFTTLPAAGAMTESGRAWTFGAGGRMMRPHDAPGLGISPWVDADLVYARTGDLSRPGFAAAVGVSMPLDNRRQFWIGPFARYFQIIQGEREGFDNRDAKIVMFGIGLEVTSGLEKKHTRIAAVEPVPVIETPQEPLPPPSDRDGDTVVDSADNCPDVAGLVDQGGCPAYEKVIVKREKLELAEKIAFAWDSAKLETVSYPALDAVVQALKDNRNFKVQVDGHASSDGNYDHNQTLSEQRATAVLDYLVSHGIAKDRLISKGFSSSQPTETNTTAAGRDSNRRVEFIVDFIIIPEGNTP